MKNKKLQEISKPRSAESLKKEFQYKENEKHARIICGCENAKENGMCLKSTLGCDKCELYDSYITAMAMANWKDKQYQSEIDGLSEKIQAENDGCWIDLGLPSGTLWSDRNVGAEAIEYYGKYFTFEEAQKQGNVPTKEQFQELIDECKWTWEGTGYKVVGMNGNSIYLPAAGCRDDSRSYDVDSCGFYWSSSACSHKDYANYMHLSNDYVFTCENYCHYRLSVRLVK